MNWSKYVGIPDALHGRSIEGADCWGLYCLVMADAHGISLPSYAGALCDRERAQIEELMSDEFSKPIWHRVEVVQPFDLLRFKMGAYASHVGCAVDSSHMLHSEMRGSSAIVSLSEWRGRLTGIYRHEALL